MNVRRNDAGGRPTMRERIAQNLAAVLNARPWFEGVTVYGLSDSAMLGPTRSQVDNLALAMRAAIEQYEPRLAQPQVRAIGGRDSIWIEFEARGAVEGASVAYLLRYSVVFRNVVVAERGAKEPV